MENNTKPIFDRDGLLERHGITVSEFQSTGLQWSLIEDICAHHERSFGDLLSAANYISQRLQQVPDIHSTKVRIKHPEHLAAKIIRKKLEHPEIDLTVQSYEALITDLIGLRALHLFKDEWRSIHDFVQTTWDLHESPIAYVRAGDPKVLLNDLTAASCKVTEHPFGYRSIHYLLKFRPDKREYIAELQVRTIFEEGWSEIDHCVRYPRRSDDVYLADFLAIFNRLAGSADEMGTFIQVLSRFAGEQFQKIAERDKTIADMEAKFKDNISTLKVSQSEKDSLKKQIEELRKSSLLSYNLPIFSSAAIGVMATEPSRPYESFIIGKPPTDASFGVSVLGTDHHVGARILDTGPHVGSLAAVGPVTGFLGGRECTCSLCGKKFTDSASPWTVTINPLLCPDCKGK